MHRQKAYGHYNEALAILGKANPNAKRYIDIRVNRTGALCELKRYDEAIAECDRIMEEYKDNADSEEINQACGWIKNNCLERKGGS